MTKNCPKNMQNSGIKRIYTALGRARVNFHGSCTKPRWKLVRASPSAVIRVLLGGMKGRVGGMAVGTNWPPKDPFQNGHLFVEGGPRAQVREKYGKIVSFVRARSRHTGWIGT